MNVLVILQCPAYGDKRSYSARRSSLDEATDWALWADKTITFSAPSAHQGRPS